MVFEINKKIMQPFFERFFSYLEHYALCTFFCKFYFPFFKNGHFYFFKNVQNRKRPKNLEMAFFEGPY
jgi:hypothetical protein